MKFAESIRTHLAWCSSLESHRPQTSATSAPPSPPRLHNLPQPLPILIQIRPETRAPSLKIDMYDWQNHFDAPATSFDVILQDCF